MKRRVISVASAKKGTKGTIVSFAKSDGTIAKSAAINIATKNPGKPKRAAIVAATIISALPSDSFLASLETVKPNTHSPNAAREASVIRVVKSLPISAKPSAKKFRESGTA